MKMVCKFCGEIFASPKMISRTDGSTKSKGYSCGGCTSYCMKSCKIASKTTMSWHRPPCVECEHNPYRLSYDWDGSTWQKMR